MSDSPAAELPASGDDLVTHQSASSEPGSGSEAGSCPVCWVATFKPGGDASVVLGPCGHELCFPCALGTVHEGLSNEHAFPKCLVCDAPTDVGPKRYVSSHAHTTCGARAAHVAALHMNHRVCLASWSAGPWVAEL